MKSSSININTDLTHLLRFDAGFHLSEGQSVKHAIGKLPYKSFFFFYVAERIFYCGRARRVYVSKKEHGIPFLSGSNILQYSVNLTKNNFQTPYNNYIINLYNLATSNKQ